MIAGPWGTLRPAPSEGSAVGGNRIVNILIIVILVLVVIWLVQAVF